MGTFLNILLFWKPAQSRNNYQKHYLPKVHYLKNKQFVGVFAGEVEELQGRLRASRHRVSELERDLSVGKEHIRTLESSVREESTHQVNLRQLNEDLG